MNSPPETPTDPSRLLGTWQLLSSEVELQDCGDRIPMYESPAVGYLLFAPDGRMMTVVEVPPDRPRAGEREQIHGYRGMAYTGRYRVHGNQWLTDVDVASIPGWSGSLQQRSFHLESDRLHVCSDWCVSPLHGGRTVRAWLIWQRAAQH
jgi:hypothetical protein